jgi:steroid delta-isomerase-like uncharacterized protein
MNTANTELARRAHKELFEAGDLSVADELFSPDFVDHAAPQPGGTGPEAIKQVVRFLHAGLDDLHYEIHDLFASGDRVTMRTTLSATHNRPFLGHPPTGVRFSAEQIHIVRIADGRIAEHWACRDDASMMRQLGMIR